MMGSMILIYKHNVSEKGQFYFFWVIYSFFEANGTLGQSATLPEKQLMSIGAWTFLITVRAAEQRKAFGPPHREGRKDMADSQASKNQKNPALCIEKLGQYPCMHTGRNKDSEKSTKQIPPN